MKNLQLFKYFLLLSFIIFLSLFTSNRSENELQEAIEPYCGGLNYEQYLEVSKRNINKINVLIPKSKNYYENLSNASRTGNFINQKFKKQINGFVEFNMNGVECRFRARIRISGDWKGHLDMNNFISSLDIRLLEGNINGITKFKLFLPRERNYENEIFVTSFLKEVGYIVPKTFFVNVNFNNFYDGKFIFQEKLAKELIERNNYREGLIFETDETFIWNNNGKNEFIRYPTDSQPLMFGKYLNDTWINKNINNFEIFQKAIALYNHGIFTSRDEFLNLKSSGFNNIEMHKFDALSIALKFQHGRLTQNRKFYFNSFNNSFYPIYYDGDSLFINEPQLTEIGNLGYPREIKLAAISLLENKISSENFHKRLNNNGYKITKNEVVNYVGLLYENLEKLSKIVTTPPSDSLENIVGIDHPSELEIVFSTKSGFIKCSSANFQNCENDNLSYEIRNTNSLINNNLIYFGDYQTFFNGTIDTLTRNEFHNISLFSIIAPDYLYIEETNTLKLQIDDPRQRYLVTSKQELPFFIELNIKDGIKPYVSNNEYLLTGCLTIYDSDFLELNIKVNNSFCEDAVNIISSEGFINNLKVRNSVFDGLDIDFSNITINDVSVENSGNDCVDLSQGTYNINKISAKNCIDKGISIGEGSIVSINSIETDNTITAVAVKDFSHVEIETLITKNNPSCLKVYQKKQEYGPSKIKVKNLNCDASYTIQSGSILER